MIHIPELESFCGSWIVIRKNNNEIIGEFFDRKNLEKFNPEKAIIKTSYQHLVDVNKTIKNQSHS